MQLIDTYRHMEPRELLDCRIKSLKELVRHYGLNLHSNEVLLLSEAFTFQYDRISIPGVGIESLPYATASHNQTETTFFHNLNIRFHKENIAGDSRGWEQLKSLIVQGIPVLFRIDSRFLKGAEDAAPKVLKLNLYYLSTLLLVGYDEEQDQALVVLTNDDDRERVNEITIGEFQTYRCSNCAPFSPEGLCYFLQPDHGVSDINPTGIQQALTNSIIKTANTMLDEGELYNGELGSFIGRGVSRGIHAMKNLKDDLQKMLAQCQDNGDSAIIRLMMVFLRNNLLFGSYSAFREEYGQCIKYYARKYNIPHLDVVGSEFAEITSLWKELFTLLSRIAHYKGDLIEHLQQVLLVWDNIIQAEHRQFSKIRSILLTAAPCRI
ncbi:BtrH N-terminal domain-containing protein [Paenibacillus sp. GCM10012306]|uniref:BtrH N-terminal domain-containing protein n=1 Tax=Paenibacillus sp. GCM10012306 TaxID=3317342 RepID=UPI003613CC07